MAHSLFDSLSGNMSNIENQSAIQSILDTQNVTETNTAQVEDDDVFQCGKCKKQFSNLSLFVGHKQTRCTPIAPRPALQNTTVIQGLGNSAFTAPAPQHGIRTQLPQNSGASFSTVNQTPLNQLTNSMVLTDDQMLAFGDITQTVQNGIIQGSTLHLGPGNTVQTNGSFLSPVTQLAPRATNNVTILSAIQPTSSLSASNGSAFTSTASVNNLQPLIPQQQLQPVFSITALPEKPQNMHIIKPSPTKAARKSAQASALNGGESDHSGYTDDGKKKLVCTYCGKVFMKNFDLQQHIRSHTGEKPFQCVVCGRAFAQKSNVKKHMSTHKVWPSGPSGSTLPVQPPAMLVPVEDEPDKSPPVEPDDTQEQQNESDEVPPESPECKQLDKEKKLLKKEQYKLKVVIDNSYMCQYCPEKFKSYYQLKSHMVKHKGFQVYKCVVVDCSQTFKDMETFIEHTATHNQDITYRCHQCSKVFPTLYELGIHQYSHSLYQNPGKSGPWHFQCTLCMSKYATPEALQHHMSTTSHEYPCPHCQKNFTCERFLRKHLASHGTENQFECSVCQKNLKTEHYLKNHMLIHTGEKPYECETCGAAFNRKDKLKRHNLIHDAKVKYKCPFKAVCGCTKEFGRPDKLKAHLLTHSSVKPYSCDICGKDFARKPHYNEHMRGHRNDYPYNCEKCKRGFFRPKLFKEHKCEDANGQLKKKRLFHPRRVKRKPGRPRKVMKTDNHDSRGSKSLYLEHGKGRFLIENLEIVPKEKDKQDLSDKEPNSQTEYEIVIDRKPGELTNVSEEPTETSGDTQEDAADTEIEQVNQDENRSADSTDNVAESESGKILKKPKPECYVKISPSLVPVSMVERYVTVQLTTTNGGEGGEIQTQLIPASEIGGQIQFATQVPGLQISPSSSATTFHPIQIIEGQPVTLTVSQGDQLGDIGVGESNVIDIPVDIVTVTNDEALLCTQEVTNDGDASEQSYGTLVNYAPDHLINSSVEILGPENM